MLSRPKGLPRLTHFPGPPSKPSKKKIHSSSPTSSFVNIVPQTHSGKQLIPSSLPPHPTSPQHAILIRPPRSPPAPLPPALNCRFTLFQNPYTRLPAASAPSTQKTSAPTPPACVCVRVHPVLPPPLPQCPRIHVGEDLCVVELFFFGRAGGRACGRGGAEGELVVIGRN